MTIPARRYGLDIFAFTSYKRYCLAFQAANPIHSWEWLAKRVGTKARRTTVHRNIKNERSRPPEEELDAYAYAFGLMHRRDDPDSAETRYFRLLVRYEHAENPDTKAYLRGEIEGLRFERRIERPTDWQGRLFAHWYIPAIAEMALHPDFQADPRWIAERAFPAIKEREAQDALQLLVELGLFEYALDGGLQVPSGALIIEIDAEGRPDTPSDPMDRLHAWYASRAAQIARRGLVRRSDRYFKGVTMALPAASIPGARALMDEFMRRLVALQQTSLEAGETPDRVYQWINHLFPLSHALDAPTGAEASEGEE